VAKVPLRCVVTPLNADFKKKPKKKDLGVQIYGEGHVEMLGDTLERSFARADMCAHTTVLLLNQPRPPSTLLESCHRV